MGSIIGADMKKFIPIAVLCLAACSGGEAGPGPKVSRAHMPPPQGQNYEQFRQSTGHAPDASKRFIMMDHDNNGHLSDDELSR